ncbi:hypothetical protein [Falsiroseomonas selenitidurans]|uniref:Autotransporter domain-containing protein n=1 Tax=Falsiroseomonas selenitidurans TaxID=2716335 RepID=A0ABX1EAD4_9PROT|nr:hypothetical protein [Falsiroseomonas selenitidurans]NKC33793.1 hypothetical protein [Falsiroseomonas selenitidurans]
MRRSAPFLVASVLLLPYAATGLAADLFRGSFVIDGQSASAGSNNIQDFADLFTNRGLRSLSSSYTDVSAATADVSLRGVPATLSYAANSTTLRFIVPSAGINESFTGATRDESQDLALEWFKGAGGAALTRLLRQAVATTAVDPLAGNPNSLMSQMGAADFNLATGAAPSAGLAGGSRFGLGARFGSYSAGDHDTQTYSLPIGYRFDFGSSGTLLIDAPMTLSSTSNAEAYSGSLGIGYRIPMRLGQPDWLTWSLTPVVRAGAVGSTEIGSVGGIWSASLTSTLTLSLPGGGDLTMGNMFGRLDTLPIKIADYDISYELSNYIYRNGLVYTRPVGEMFGRSVSASLFVLDTRFTGDDLYVKSYQEFGAFLNIGDPIRILGAPVPVRIGATYLTGENDYRGFTLNLGVTF